MTANVERCAELLEGNLSLATALAPCIGYDAAAAIAKAAFARAGRCVSWPERAGRPAPRRARACARRAAMTEPGIPGT